MRGVGQQHVSGRVTLGQLDADIVAIRVKRHPCGAGAESAAFFEHPAGKARGQHARRGIIQAQFLLETGITLFIQLIFKNDLALCVKFTRRIVELKIGKGVEGRVARSKPDRDIRLEARCRGPVQPLAEQFALERHIRDVQGLLAEIEFHLEAVGDHGFNLELLAEGLAAQDGPGGPVTGQIFFAGFQFEGIEVIHRLVVGRAVNQLALGVIQVHGHRMTGGDDVLFVLQHESEINIVSRPPDPALSIDITFDTLLDLLAADIEMAGGQGGALAELEITALPVVVGNQIKRPTAEIDGGHALFVRGGLADGLVLEIQESQLDICQGA